MCARALVLCALRRRVCVCACVRASVCALSASGNSTPSVYSIILLLSHTRRAAIRAVQLLLLTTFYNFYIVKIFLLFFFLRPRVAVKTKPSDFLKSLSVVEYRHLIPAESVPSSSFVRSWRACFLFSFFSRFPTLLVSSTFSVGNNMVYRRDEYEWGK